GKRPRFERSPSRSHSPYLASLPALAERLHLSREQRLVRAASGRTECESLGEPGSPVRWWTCSGNPRAEGSRAGRPQSASAGKGTANQRRMTRWPFPSPQEPRRNRRPDARGGSSSLLASFLSASWVEGI